MPASQESFKFRPDALHGEALKKSLREFVTNGLFKPEYERHLQLFLEMSDATENEVESVLDWFIFDWFDDNGEGIIDHFLASNPDLGEGDQDILLDWEDSINSVFEVQSLTRHLMGLLELDTKAAFNVILPESGTKGKFERGQYIAARLLPVGDNFVLSGLQFVMPDREAAIDWLEMRRALEAVSSPEALEEAQREQCSAFRECFGGDEVTVSPRALRSTVSRFQNFLFKEHRYADTGLTPADVFKSELGQELVIPGMSALPDRLVGFGSVTLLCDDFEGILLLPDFKKFKSVFESQNPDDEIPGWRDLVWNYIEEPNIPLVAFERVAEVNSQGVERVLRTLLDKADFSIDHLYAALLHYKEPVAGLDDLEDDEKLWDLLDGGTEIAAEASAKRKTAHKKIARSGNPPAKSKAPRSGGVRAASSPTADVAKKPLKRKKIGSKTRKKPLKTAAAASRKVSSSAKASRSARAAGARNTRARKKR